MVDHTFMSFHYPSADSLDPMDHFCTFDVSKIIPKNMHYLPYATFKPILAYVHWYDPKTYVHQDVYKRPNNFGVLLMSIRVTCLLAFHIPWDRSDLTFHYPIEALHKEPFGYIEEEEFKRKKTIVHCCCSLLILESASLCPLENFLCFPSLHLLVILLSRYGGLRWWRPRWRTQFLRFADVPTEVVTIVISDLYYRNIFSYPIMCN